MPKSDRKVAIVTGSATGVGAAAAILLAEHGCNVVINYTRSKKEADETSADCQAKGVETIVFQADVSDDDACQAMVKAAADKWGRIDYLINNAARTKFNPYKKLDGVSKQDFLDIYAVNVVGAYQMVRAVVPHMKKQGHGRIINLASVAGLWPQGSSIAYCCSKAAVIQLSKCLARTLGPEIQVNVIAPGFIAETRWNVGRPNLEPTIAKAAQVAPLKRVGTAEDIADAALFLATRGDFMTGDVMVVDGGRLVA